MEGRASARPHIHGNNVQIVPPEGRSSHRPHAFVQTFGHTEVWPSNGKTGRYLRRRDDLRIVRMWAYRLWPFRRTALQKPRGYVIPPERWLSTFFHVERYCRFKGWESEIPKTHRGHYSNVRIVPKFSSKTHYHSLFRPPTPKNLKLSTST